MLVQRCCAVGYPLVPSFSGTAHSFTGATLNRAIDDCLQLTNTPTRDDMTKSYVCLSRVRQAQDLLLAQPFSPALFRQGAIVGAQLLLQTLCGVLPEAQLRDEWARMDSDYSQVQRSFKSLKWTCGECSHTLVTVNFRVSPG